MTRTTNARLAGVTFLFYIAAALPSTILFDRAARGDGIAARLASVAQHTSEVRVAIVLSLLSSFTALVLAVALYGITRDEDHELAVFALSCRVGEGVIGAVFLIVELGVLWLGTSAGAGAPDATAAYALGAFLLRARGWGVLLSAMFFAVGSTIFSWLLLRGRTVPVPLAWLGVLASVLLVALLPAQLAGVLRGPMTSWMWMPMLAFEVPLALWLLIKGVAIPETRPPTHA